MEQAQQADIQPRPTKSGTVYTSSYGEYAPLPDIEDNTLSKQFLLRVKEMGKKVAVRKKRYGIWQEYTSDTCTITVFGAPRGRDRSIHDLRIQIRIALKEQKKRLRPCVSRQRERRCSLLQPLCSPRILSKPYWKTN